MIGRRWKRCKACRLSILIGRGLDPTQVERPRKRQESSVSRCAVVRVHEGREERERGSSTDKVHISGGNDERVPPVPIPNTEVKPLSADGTWLDTARESRSPPDPNKCSISYDVERFSISFAKHLPQTGRSW